MGVAAGDFDNDGHVDLLVTGLRGITLYRNRGDGAFEDVTATAGLGSSRSWAVSAGWFDYDNDGWLDLFVTHYVEWSPDLGGVVFRAGSSLLLPSAGVPGTAEPTLSQ